MVRTVAIIQWGCVKKPRYGRCLTANPAQAKRSTEIANGPLTAARQGCPLRGGLQWEIIYYCPLNLFFFAMSRQGQNKNNLGRSPWVA